VAGARLARSLLFSNVHVELESELEDCVVLPDVSIGPGCKIRHAVIDKGCVIPPHTIIWQDPARDKERFFVSPGGVILVTPEALGQERHLLR
jgi:glucose-1-phosphate adenylyltransferase